MSRRERRSFSKEFKAQAVELVLSSGQSIGKIAKDLDLTESALERWVKQAKEFEGGDEARNAGGREGGARPVARGEPDPAHGA